MRKTISILLLLVCCNHIFAQDSSAIISSSDTIVNVIQQEIPTKVSEEKKYTASDFSDNVIKHKKFSVDRVRILLSSDFSFYNPIIKEKDAYAGEYYPVKDSNAIWTERNTATSFKKAGNIQFGLQVNFWKGLFVGMNYQFFTIQNFKKDPNLGNFLSKKNTMFFLIGAQFGYSFDFLKNKCLQIHPSFRLGGYAGDDYYDRGTGKKIYLGFDFKLRYLIKRKFGFSVGATYDHLMYKRNGYSDLFQRNYTQKTSFDNFHVNVGFCYNITINPKKKY
jgi:hypothetical protein